jgi:uncharacterized cofD-like protein
MMLHRLRITGIGGGTGLSALLAGLREVAVDPTESVLTDLEITAIVCVADNGGSSGRLSLTLGIPAVGDLRNCLVALSSADRAWKDLLQHRFCGGEGLQGHALGNLMLAALCQRHGSLKRAADTASRLLAVEGRVLPASESPVTLCAEVQNGAVVQGEHQITAARQRIRRVWLEPEIIKPSPGVLEAIREADAVVLGPGSLYTSVIPNLLIPGIAEAVRRAPAVKIFVCNLMTQPGETDGFAVSDHLGALEPYLGRGVVDLCLMNWRAGAAKWESYRQAGSYPVRCDWRDVEQMGVVPVRAALASEEGRTIRHDPAKLARLIVSLARTSSGARELCYRPAEAAA